MTEDIADRHSIEYLITLYELEREIKDIYVEGTTDKNLVEWYLEEKNISNFNIIEISNINIPNELIDEFKFERNNRDRIIVLINKLNNSCSSNSYKGLIDKDLLKYTRGLPSEKNLLLTDNSCIEMYFNSEYIIRKIMKIGYNKEHCSDTTFIEAINSFLKYVFSLRIYEKNHKLNFSKSDFKKFITTCKCTTINFDHERYIKCILNNNKIPKSNEIYLEIIKIHNDLHEENTLDTVHGHDFLNFLRISLYKLKIIDNKTSAEDLESILKCSLEITYLEQFKLFNELNKYYNV